MAYFKHFNLELNGTFLPPLAPNNTYLFCGPIWFSGKEWNFIQIFLAIGPCQRDNSRCKNLIFIKNGHTYI